ncbi:hypothetical protein CRE_30115 [Caenorhabditis remanei]|uniref:Uncharacterized protein n=1 Tax=Caenorhabditis remanei TaxID=31234 RepID=E3MYD5_CAERE|nr:hypothetical protein CRE_30115 [Caenorhabditis remanei]
MAEGEVEVPETDVSVLKSFSAGLVLAKVMEVLAEQSRQKLFIVGTRSRQGDLKGFLEYRLVSKTFNEAVCATIRKEFKHIQVDIDDHFVRCNEFTIGRHQKPPIRQGPNQFPNVNRRNPQEVWDEEMIAAEDLPSEDSVDVQFLYRFFRWLARTFDPMVESFKIFDSWSFKPCSLPPSWANRLSVFNSMHPDMQYCNCDQCIQTVRRCRGFFGPVSFQMATDAWREQSLSYGAISCTDAFLADIALQYTVDSPLGKRFESDRFIREFGGIRCNEITFAVQTLATYRDEHPKSQPLEVIQLILSLWQVKSVEFEVVKFMENDYYTSRCAWETSGAFTRAYFSTYRFDVFDDDAHGLPYRSAGTLDRHIGHEIVPIFDLRIDPTDGPFRMGSNLSLLSLASQDNDSNSFSWLHQGRIAFNMFRANRIMFVTSGLVEFRGMIGTVRPFLIQKSRTISQANWIKFTIRDMMRCIWGPRTRQGIDHGKTVFWISFMEDVGFCISKVWNEHIQELLQANFPHLVVKINTPEAFEKCGNRKIATYADAKRPDVLNKVNFYIS